MEQELEKLARQFKELSPDELTELSKKFKALSVLYFEETREASDNLSEQTWGGLYGSFEAAARCMDKAAAGMETANRLGIERKVIK